MACYRDDLHDFCRLTQKLGTVLVPLARSHWEDCCLLPMQSRFSSLRFYLCLFLMCVSSVHIVPLITAPSSAARYSMWPVWTSCRNSSPWTASRSQSASLGESPPEHCRTTSASSKPELFLKCLLLRLAIWTLTSRLDKELKEAAENSK